LLLRRRAKLLKTGRWSAISLDNKYSQTALFVLEVRGEAKEVEEAN
jgi:hypothetical protein